MALPVKKFVRTPFNTTPCGRAFSLSPSDGERARVRGPRFVVHPTDRLMTEWQILFDAINIGWAEDLGFLQ
jgi:hypothetical protein